MSTVPSLKLDTWVAHGHSKRVRFEPDDLSSLNKEDYSALVQMPSETVSEVMSKKVSTLSPKRKTSDALNMMIKHDFGSVVITEHGKVVGIITERDIVRKITKSFDYLNRPLSETDSKPVISVSPDTPIWEAFSLMLRNKIRRLPILKRNRLVGIVTERDLFKWVVKVAYEPNIPDDIKKLLVDEPI